MDKFIMMINSIDWVFAGIILVGGRYFGAKYFRLSKRDSLNFLGFATAFAVLWLMIKYWTFDGGIPKAEVGNLFITYLFTTSFYELLAKYLLEKLESVLPWFKKDNTVKETTITIKGGEVKEIKEVTPEDKKP